MPRQPMVVCLMLLLSAPVSAQSLKLPTIAFFAAAGADGASTAYNLSKGYGYEANPLVQWADNKPFPVVASVAAMDVASVWAWNKFVGKKHPKIAAVGLYIATAYRIHLVAKGARTRGAYQRFERYQEAIAPYLPF